MQCFTLSPEDYKKTMGFITDKPIKPPWKQPFEFKGSSICLFQRSGGPCGLFAVVQSYIHYINMYNQNLTANQLLIEAILAIQSRISSYYAFPLLDDQNMTISYSLTDNIDTARSFLSSGDWLHNQNAIINFLISIVILTGYERLQSYAIPDTFITEDGQTNLTFVLLALSGSILDSYHDNNCDVGGMILKGATQQQTIGVISLGSSDMYQPLGNNFLKPKTGIWVAYYGGHFTSIVATDCGFFEFDSLSRNLFFQLVEQKHAFYNKLNSL